MSCETTPSAPEGFRSTSDAEEREIREQAFRLALLEERLKRYQSELIAAQLNLQKTLSEYNIASEQARKLNEKLGVLKDDDMVVINGRYFIRNHK